MNEATIRLHIGKLADGGFLATSVDVPGLVAEGRSIAEATEIAQGLAFRTDCLRELKKIFLAPDGES